MKTNNNAYKKQIQREAFEAGQKSERESICIIIDDELKTAKANKSKTGYTVDSILQMVYNIGSRIEGQKGSDGDSK